VPSLHEIQKKSLSVLALYEPNLDDPALNRMDRIYKIKSGFTILNILFILFKFFAFCLLSAPRIMVGYPGNKV
jgi:hypothetical protein